MRPVLVGLSVAVALQKRQHIVRSQKSITDNLLYAICHILAVYSAKRISRNHVMPIYYSLIECGFKLRRSCYWTFRINIITYSQCHYWRIILSNQNYYVAPVQKFSYSYELVIYFSDSGFSIVDRS